MKLKNKMDQITKLQMKFLLIITLILSGCSHREGVDFPVGDRSYNIALMSGHGYFVPVYKSDYLPRWTSKPSERPDQTSYGHRITTKIQ